MTKEELKAEILKLPCICKGTFDGCIHIKLTSTMAFTEADFNTSPLLAFKLAHEKMKYALLDALAEKFKLIEDLENKYYNK